MICGTHDDATYASPVGDFLMVFWGWNMHHLRTPVSDFKHTQRRHLHILVSAWTLEQQHSSSRHWPLRGDGVGRDRPVKAQLRTPTEGVSTRARHWSQYVFSSLSVLELCVLWGLCHGGGLYLDTCFIIIHIMIILCVCIWFVRVLSWWRFVPRYMIIIIIIIIYVFVRGLCCAEFVLAEGLCPQYYYDYYFYYYYLYL